MTTSDSVDRRKKILMVAYHFPPDAAVGALRPQKFVKYLPEFAWQPYVVTIKEQYIEKSDKGRLKDVEGITIHRTSFWRTPLQLLLDLSNTVRSKNNQQSTKFKADTPALESVRVAESFSKRLKRYFVSLNWFPDDKLYWTIPALFAGYRLIRREQIRVIYATSPPHTVSIIGFLLSLITGASLVIDFRDPWTLFRCGLPEEMRCQLYDFLEDRAEKMVVKRAHAVICTTERMTVAMQRKYPTVPSDKFITILNGYDAVDMEQATTPRRDNSLYVITYLGTFYLDRTPETFLQALNQAINEGDIPAKGVEVRFIGAVNSACGKSLDQMIAENDMTETVSVTGQIPHRQALQQMLESDLLLLLAPNQEYQIPAKALEYIGSKRPILALTGEGATADLIRSTHAGIVVPQNDVTGIYEALKRFYAHHINAEKIWYQGVDTTIYTRNNLTRQLADLLK